MEKKQEDNRDIIISDSGEFILPSLFQSGEFYHFKPWEMRILNAIKEEGGSLERVAEREEIELDSIKKFLNRKEIVKFLTDKAKEIAIKRGVTSEWWVASGLESLRASKDKKMTKVDVEIWKELGSRIIPKVESIQHKFDDTDFIFIAKKRKNEVIDVKTKDNPPV